MTESVLSLSGTNPSSESIPTSLSQLQLRAGETPTLANTIAGLKRSTLSPSNRLRSIDHDSAFVRDVSVRHGLPCIANERCGSWYIPPELRAGSCYFKSTDGHHGQWAFSTRRLNLHILQVIGKAGGCVIVDSTRRGKSMPDALSKTVPIWCAVLNRLLFADSPALHELLIPDGTVSESEKAQIEARMHRFMEDVETLNLDKDALRAAVRKPLRPFWVTPESSDPGRPAETCEHNRVICCAASRRVRGAEMSEDGYIQGAGDDSEGWSRGLTPALFWLHREKLLAMNEEEMVDFIQRTRHNQEPILSGLRPPTQIGCTGMHIGTPPNLKGKKPYDAIIICHPLPSTIEPPDLIQDGLRILQLEIGTGKLASRSLRTQLARVVSFLRPSYDSRPCRLPDILITCEDVKDIPTGIALVVHCLFFSDDNTPLESVTAGKKIDKTLIRRRLAIISSYLPEANPSRATLQSVHAFLMPRKDEQGVE